MGIKHDPAEFWVPPSLGKDDKGGRVQLYIQQGHVRAAEILARSGLFPWRLPNDAFRYCIKKGLDYIDNLEPTLINSVMRRANMMIAAGRELEERLKFQEVFDILRDRIAGARTEFDKDEVRRLITYYESQIGAMPDEPVNEFMWKMRYTNELQPYKEQVERW